MEHSKDCVGAFSLHNVLVAEYEKSYPNYCTHCQGWGGSWSKYDPSPSGISLSPGFMYEFDPCPKCVENSICPRCGKELYDADEVICKECGFNGKEDEGLPQPPECWCYLDSTINPFNWE